MSLEPGIYPAGLCTVSVSFVAIVGVRLTMLKGGANEAVVRMLISIGK